MSDDFVPLKLNRGFITITLQIISFCYFSENCTFGYRNQTSISMCFFIHNGTRHEKFKQGNRNCLVKKKMIVNRGVVFHEKTAVIVCVRE